MTIHELSIQDSAGSRVRIAPDRGALLTSWTIEGREVFYLDEGTFRDLSKNVRGGIPVLFPTPGKLSGDRWQFDGKAGALMQHGFARTQSWSVVAHRSDELILRLVANDATLAAFPWAFTADLRFSLRDRSLRVGMTIRNDDSVRMPFACGFHPYFLVGDKRQVRIPTRATRAFNNVTKEIDALSELRLNEGETDLHLLDHAMDRAELRCGDGQTIVVKASPEFWLWVVWTLPDKDFVCLEPWTAQGNALNSGERLLLLEPAAARELWMEIDWVDR